MTHFGFRAVKGIHERSRGEIVRLYFVFPVAMGLGLLTLVGAMTLRFSGDFAGRDWFGAVWGVVLSLTLMIGLPATGWKELQRRRHRPASGPATGPEQAT